MEGKAYHWIFPEDGLLLGQNVSEQNEIVHVSWKNLDWFHVHHARYIKHQKYQNAELLRVCRWYNQ